MTARGMCTVADLRSRCTIDTATHCWLWTGAISGDGCPRLWTFDHARGEKRSMSGPLAAWNIAHGRAPLPGWLVQRRCVVKLCLNPAHLREARDRADMGRHVALSGKRKGTALESRRANIAKAQAAAGITPTPAAVVLAIRAAGPEPTNIELANMFGVRHTTVSMIRLGKSHKHLLEAA